MVGSVAVNALCLAAGVAIGVGITSTTATTGHGFGHGSGGPGTCSSVAAAGPRSAQEELQERRRDQKAFDGANGSTTAEEDQDGEWWNHEGQRLHARGEFGRAADAFARAARLNGFAPSLWYATTSSSATTADNAAAAAADTAAAAAAAAAITRHHTIHFHHHHHHRRLHHHHCHRQDQPRYRAHRPQRRPRASR